VAGFGSQVELGGFGVIRDDPTVVLRVMPLARNGEQAPRVLRMRGTSFDHYDGRRWTRSAVPLREPREARSIYPIRRMPDERRDEQLRIVLDHLDEPVVFLPAGTVAIAIPPRISAGIGILRELTYSPGLDLRYEDNDGLGLTYTAYVSNDPAERDLAAMPAEQRAAYLQVPRGHERVAQLARQVAGDADTDVDKARRIERFLKYGEFQYSLTQPAVGKRWPLDVFLFEAKRGHCEYYSSALAVMLRTLGIATRNVAGFAGGRYNPYGHYYALRQGDAHSWVEVYVRGRGWVTFDPTPPARAGAGPRETLWSEWSAMIDALRTRWTTSVVGYDLRTQVGLLQRISRWLSELRGHREHSGAAPEAGEEAAHHSRSLGAKERSVGMVLAVAVVLWFAWRKLRRRRAHAGRPTSRKQAQLVAVYTELERALERRGHRRAAACTPLEHAQRLAAQGFEQSAEVEVVTQRYLEARYGGRVLEGSELHELRKAIARVRKAA
jgi:transglutaminase-like putative cysteine protease